MDRRWPEQGLLLAGWTLSGGETHCPDCAQTRGFTKPPGFADTDLAAQAQPPGLTAAPSVPAGIALADEETSAATIRYLRAALATAGLGAVALAAVVLIVALRTVPNSWVRPLALGGMFGLLLLFGGLAGAVRAKRWRILLAGSAWRAYRLTYVPLLSRSPGLVLAPEDASLPPLMLRLGKVFKWRSLLLKTASGRLVWVGGDPEAHAVLTLHPGLRLFPAEPISRHLVRYQTAAARTLAVESLAPAVRRVAIMKAHSTAELKLVIAWGSLGLLTIWRPTTLAWLVLAAESVVWGAAIVRLRMARDRELEAVDLEGEAGASEPEQGAGRVPG